MGIKRFTNFWVLILVSIVTLTVFLPNGIAQDYTQMSLPEGAKFRIGKGYINDLEFSPDGDRLAIAGSIGIWVYDVFTGRELNLLTKHTGYTASSISYSPDGKTIAGGHSDGTILLWDAITGNRLKTFTGHTRWIKSICYSPDGETLASGSTGDTIRLWDVATGAHLKTLKGDFENMCYSPDGKMIASGDSIWDADTGRHLKTLTGHNGSVNSISYSPNGKTIAGGGRETKSSNSNSDISFESVGTIYLWDAATGEALKTLTEYTTSINSMCYSPDGRTLAIAGGSYFDNDGAFRLWDVGTSVNVSAKLLAPLRLEHTELSVLDLKARYRGLKYLHETLKILPQKPDAIVIDEIAERLGSIGETIHHTPSQLNTS